MESGLEDRNNSQMGVSTPSRTSLNGVRPRRPEQSEVRDLKSQLYLNVSMESGLEDRNNLFSRRIESRHVVVSMESGLEDRNNPLGVDLYHDVSLVSMESGLEDRNN